MSGWTGFASTTASTTTTTAFISSAANTSTSPTATSQCAGRRLRPVRSCRFVTVTNCTFSTRWSVFRFGGGNPENITVSNCVIYETYGCPIKLHFGPDSRVQNMLFSNLVMQDVTGPISINLNNRGRGDSATAEPPRGGYLRNITFQGIRATVVSQGRQYADMAFQQNYRPGETRQCIVLNALGDSVIENITFNDVRLTYGGGGTADDAAREIPQVAGEYFEIGTPPAYGLYARNVRGLSLIDVRFEVAEPDVRPAVVLDHVTDAEFGQVSGKAIPRGEIRVPSDREPRCPGDARHASSPRPPRSSKSKAPRHQRDRCRWRRSVEGVSPGDSRSGRFEEYGQAAVVSGLRG